MCTLTAEPFTSPRSSSVFLTPRGCTQKIVPMRSIGFNFHDAIGHRFTVLDEHIYRVDIMSVCKNWQYTRQCGCLINWDPSTARNWGPGDPTPFYGVWNCLSVCMPYRQSHFMLHFFFTFQLRGRQELSTFSQFWTAPKYTYILWCARLTLP